MSSSSFLRLSKRKSITQGFALPLALFALIITSIIAAASVKLGLLDQQLARTQSDVIRAKQNAELTIHDAIDHILCKVDKNNNPIPNANLFTGTSPFVTVAESTCVAGICGKHNDLNNPLWQNIADKTTAELASYGQYTKQDNFSNTLVGRYMIEAVQTNVYTGTGLVNHNSNTEFQYRITAVGFGRANTQVNRVIQVLFRTKQQRCSYNPAQTTPAGYI